VALYVILGLLGLPIFTQGGGIQYIFQPTFGYLIGYAVGAYVCGAIAHANEDYSLARLVVASVVNLAIVYVLGAVYGWIILNYVNHVEYGVKAIIESFVAPFIVKDLVVCVLSGCFAKRLLPILEKQFKLAY
jgi:biotin transport system substrate-specific component